MQLRLGMTLFLMAVSIPVAADPSVLTIATSEYPPYEYRQGGNVVGTDTETVRTVVTAMGYKPVIEVLPWIRAEAKVRQGLADMIYSLTYSRHRAQYYHFTDPINTVHDVFFKHRDSDIAWQTLDDLAGLNIGISASYSYSPDLMDWLRQGKAQVTEISHEHPELTSLRMLAAKRIHLFVCEQSVCEYLLKTHGSAYPELQAVEPVPGHIGKQRGFRAAFSRKHPRGEALRDQFNQALKQYRKTDIE